MVLLLLPFEKFVCVCVCVCVLSFQNMLVEWFSYTTRGLFCIVKVSCSINCVIIVEMFRWLGCRCSKHVCLPVTKYQELCSFIGTHLSTAYHKKSCCTYFEISFLINNVAHVLYVKKFYSQWVMIIICSNPP